MWQSAIDLHAEQLPQPQGEWFVAPGSLTARFADEFGEKINFRLLHSGWAASYTEESALLGSSTTVQHWVREINWCCAGECWVVARAVIPPLGSHSPLNQILQLGADSIGCLLFADDEILKHPLQFAQLGVQHPYFGLAKPWLGASDSQVWARRRLFEYQGDVLMVSEVFLPSFFAYNLKDALAG